MKERLVDRMNEVATIYTLRREQFGVRMRKEQADEFLAGVTRSSDYRDLFTVESCHS